MALDTEMMTTTEVKTIAIVNSNIDTAYIDQYILMAQRQYIRKFLGNDFYEELLTQIDASSLTSDNTDIMVYVKNALAHFIVFESMPQLRNQIVKGGVMQHLSETSEPASGLDYGRLRDDYLVKAERFREEIDFYIMDVREDTPLSYPLYCGKSDQNIGIIMYD